MSLLGIIGLSITEILGDTSLKEYANGKGIFYLGIGVLGYVGVIILLIINLQGSTLLIVNNAWDGTSSLIGSLYAYAILGERFDNYLQYIGAIFIIFGLYFLKIPLKRTHPFYIPA
jgi:hypothetical protein